MRLKRGEGGLICQLSVLPRDGSTNAHVCSTSCGASLVYTAHCTRLMGACGSDAAAAVLMGVDEMKIMAGRVSRSRQPQHRNYRSTPLPHPAPLPSLSQTLSPLQLATERKMSKRSLSGSCFLLLLRWWDVWQVWANTTHDRVV